jgi:glutamate--cysteine ligase
MYLPHATSLRMGKLGYQSDAQSTLAVSYNSLESYAASLHQALTRPYPAYEALGLRGPGGDYHQLATSLLQIENEFYGTIRPKRVIHQGERPLHALRERGVEYVEVRCMDLDPFLPLGIDAPTMSFIDVFLLYCLLADSPDDTPSEITELAHNQDRVAMRGREPGLTLERGGREVTLVEWAEEILAACAPIAAAVDRAQGGTAHVDALRIAASRLATPASLPSARVIGEITDRFDRSYTRFVRSCAAQTREDMLALPYPPELHARMLRLVQESIAAQARLEAADTMPFEIYRQEYLSTRRLGV